MKHVRLCKAFANPVGTKLLLIRGSEHSLLDVPRSFLDIACSVLKPLSSQLVITCEQILHGTSGLEFPWTVEVDDYSTRLGRQMLWQSSSIPESVLLLCYSCCYRN